MWPWAHLGFGYLLYRVTPAGRSPPLDGAAVLAVAFGTQFPDLIDKPLAWYLGVLPSGRSLAHSLLAFVLVVGVARAVAGRYDRPAVAGGFGVGYLSHLLGDSLHALVTVEWADLSFLLWPLLEPPIPPEGETIGVLAHLRDIEGSPFFLFGLLLTGAMVVLWDRHGWPGVTELRMLFPRGE